MRLNAYKKKPVEIVAAHVDCLDHDGLCEIIDWINRNGGEAFAAGPEYVEDPDTDIVIGINTLEGTMYASCGDYIICGVAGEFYPCRADIFEQTYEYIWG